MGAKRWRPHAKARRRTGPSSARMPAANSSVARRRHFSPSLRDAMRVLVTRPQPDASRTAAILESLGHEVMVDPLLNLEPMVTEMPAGPFDALAATSANAMRIAATLSGVDALRDLPLFPVGTHTACAASEAGFMDVRDADGDAAA